MFGRSDGIRHAPAQPQRKAEQKSKSKLRRNAKAFNRNTKKSTCYKDPKART